MKNLGIIGLALFLICSCKTSKDDTERQTKTASLVDYRPYGDTIQAEGAISHQNMWKTYVGLKVKDTISSKFTAQVVDVCKAKGCWMKLKLEDGQEAMVKFKDYGFFMPRDVVGKNVVVNGLAFVEEMSVEDQQHYAADAGKSDSDLALITMPKKTYGFEADGVLIEQ